MFVLIAEHIPTACARVDALRSHGYIKEALRLAVSIVRTMKLEQKRNQERYRDLQRDIGMRQDDSLDATETVSSLPE